MTFTAVKSLIVFGCAALFIFAFPGTTHSQIVEIPDCDLFPEGPDCPPLGPDPVLIIPGIAASHNSKKILKDEEGGTWRFTPTVDWFDSLIERLGQEGFVQGENLFVVHYDWRQGNEESAQEYLVPAIELAKAQTGAEKVDIVAHSMGGLVARAYLQSEDLYQDDVDQFIMLGTPNEGAADAYVVWESGDFPKRWSIGSRAWIKRIARSLNKKRGLDLDPPLSFRTFFPSLKELLPINSFVTRGTTQLTPDQLEEKNLFLSELRETANRLSLRDIHVTTVAGDEKQTLHKVKISHERSLEDLTLNRWRDGHANPDPPPTDSNLGDQTVLKESVHSVGPEHITIAGAAHEELPGKAQNEVVSKLVDTPQGDFVPQQLATAAIGVDVLSPITPTIHGPGGQTLSATTNTFPEATFDYDPSDPSEPKMLTILDPPPGTYTVNLQGTGSGEYTVITSYADPDEERFSEREGTTKLHQQETYQFAVGATTFVAPPGDVVSLLNELPALLKRLRLQDHLSAKGFSRLFGTASRLQSWGAQYQRSVSREGINSKSAKNSYQKMKADFKTFVTELDKQIVGGALDAVAMEELLSITTQLKDAGL